MPIDLPPLPNLWLPPKPAIIRASSMKDVELAMPLLSTAGGLSARGFRSAKGVAYETPSYANSGGTGNRTGLFTVTTGLTVSNGTLSNVINGVMSIDASGGIIFNNVAWTGVSALRFDRGAGNKVIINEMRMVGQVGGFNSGTVVFRASDDASTWTQYGSAVTWVSDAGPNVYTELASNVTPYRYYEIFGASGNSNNNVWCVEWEFKIGNLI